METPRVAGALLGLTERTRAVPVAPVARVAEDTLARFALSLALADGLVERDTFWVPTERRPLR